MSKFSLKKNQHLDIWEDDSDDRTVTQPPESLNKQILSDNKNQQDQLEMSIMSLLNPVN